LNLVLQQLRGDAGAVNHMRENVGLRKQLGELFQNAFAAPHSHEPIMDNRNPQSFTTLKSLRMIGFRGFYRIN